ncbi:MAG: class I SAM-dependent methyltransferase [Gammaproteobacteria bacterium]
MIRTLEPELMEGEAQVEAYAKADFSEAHGRFIEMLATVADPAEFSGTALDLGCGPGDISRRFVESYPRGRLVAVDGSKPMLDYARIMIPAPLLERIDFIHGRLPEVKLPALRYALIFSNSLLHHLPEPRILWDFIKCVGHPGDRVAVMDLLRPGSIEQAQNMVEWYAASEPAILRHDFYHSLLAAFTMPEIHAQLEAADLDFSVAQVSDRHVFITGSIT